MEHSALHGLLLTGLIISLGGPVAVLWLLWPTARAFGMEREPFTFALLKSAARWTCLGALGAALATGLDFFVQVAEFKGQTIFGGADLQTIVRFALITIVGRLCLVRLGLLIAIAISARLQWKGRWWLTGGLALAAVLVTSMVSHAAAQPVGRAVAIASQIIHIAAAALWMGVLLHLFVARKELLGEASGRRIAFVADVVRRFSPLALTTTTLLGISGVVSLCRTVTSVDMLFTSPYGLTLVVKLSLLLPAIYAGYVNFRQIRPRLLQLAGKEGESSAGAGVLAWFSRMLELEITAGVLVITVAGILGSVSPPGQEEGAQRLNIVQERAFLHPHLPNTDIRDWDKQEDPRGITVAAMRYSAFTHNWSGVMVCLMGISWLAQSAGSPAVKRWAGRIFPFLFIPFGIFIALAADPELWILHIYGVKDAFTNPILFEHQVGAIMVFVIAWLAWRDQKNPEAMRPLGYPLPIIMIVGSLLLLGHAHSLTTIPDDLTNLINTQHAVFGALGLFAGTTRLFMLRGSFPSRAAGVAWPCFVIGLGVFMAFFYRELI